MRINSYYFISLVALIFPFTIGATAQEFNSAQSPTKRTPVEQGAGAPQPVPSTNAERFQQGLPPLAPRIRKRVDGLAKRATASSVPCSALSNPEGTIAVSDAVTGDAMGFITNSPTGAFGSYTLTTDPSSALVVILPSNAPYIDNFATLAIDLEDPYLGAQCISINCVFGVGVFGWAAVTGEETEVPAGSPPSGDTSTESDIWSLSCSLVLSAQWVNPDTSVFTASTFYDADGDILGLTGDLGVYNENTGDTATLVTFTFVPIGSGGNGGAAPSG